MYCYNIGGDTGLVDTVFSDLSILGNQIDCRIESTDSFLSSFPLYAAVPAVNQT